MTRQELNAIHDRAHGESTPTGMRLPPTPEETDALIAQARDACDIPDLRKRVAELDRINDYAYLMLNGDGDPKSEPNPLDEYPHNTSAWGICHSIIHGCGKLAMLRARVAELESDLTANAAMLARQGDLAREAETEASRLRKDTAGFRAALEAHEEVKAQLQAEVAELRAALRDAASEVLCKGETDGQ